MTIRDELIEELLAGKDPQKVFSSDGRWTSSRRRWLSAFSMPRWTSIWQPSGPRRTRAKGETIAMGIAAGRC